MRSSEGITQLLIDWGKGDQAALEKLMPLVYSELRRLASNYLRRERVSITVVLKHELRVIARMADDSGRQDHHARSSVHASNLKYFSIRRWVEHGDRVPAGWERCLADIKREGNIGDHFCLRVCVDREHTCECDYD